AKVWALSLTAAIESRLNDAAVRPTGARGNDELKPRVEFVSVTVPVPSGFVAAFGGVTLTAPPVIVRAVLVLAAYRLMAPSPVLFTVPPVIGCRTLNPPAPAKVRTFPPVVTVPVTLIGVAFDPLFVQLWFAAR